MIGQRSYCSGPAESLDDQGTSQDVSPMMSETADSDTLDLMATAHDDLTSADVLDDTRRRTILLAKRIMRGSGGRRLKATSNERVQNKLKSGAFKLVQLLYLVPNKDTIDARNAPFIEGYDSSINSRRSNVKGMVLSSAFPRAVQTFHAGFTNFPEEQGVSVPEQMNGQSSHSFLRPINVRSPYPREVSHIRSISAGNPMRGLSRNFISQKSYLTRPSSNGNGRRTWVEAKVSSEHGHEHHSPHTSTEHKQHSHSSSADNLKSQNSYSTNIESFWSEHTDGSPYEAKVGHIGGSQTRNFHSQYRPHLHLEKKDQDVQKASQKPKQILSIDIIRELFNKMKFAESNIDDKSPNNLKAISKPSSPSIVTKTITKVIFTTLSSKLRIDPTTTSAVHERGQISICCDITGTKKQPKKGSRKLSPGLLAITNHKNDTILGHHSSLDIWAWLTQRLSFMPSNTPNRNKTPLQSSNERLLKPKISSCPVNSITPSKRASSQTDIDSWNWLYDDVSGADTKDKISASGNVNQEVQAPSQSAHAYPITTMNKTKVMLQSSYEIRQWSDQTKSQTMQRVTPPLPTNTPKIKSTKAVTSDISISASKTADSSSPTRTHSNKEGNLRKGKGHEGKASAYNGKKVSHQNAFKEIQLGKTPESEDLVHVLGPIKSLVNAKPVLFWGDGSWDTGSIPDWSRDIIHRRRDMHDEPKEDTDKDNIELFLEDKYSNNPRGYHTGSKNGKKIVISVPKTNMVNNDISSDKRQVNRNVHLKQKNNGKTREIANNIIEESRKTRSIRESYAKKSVATIDGTSTTLSMEGQGGMPFVWVTSGHISANTHVSNNVTINGVPDKSEDQLDTSRANTEAMEINPTSVLPKITDRYTPTSGLPNTNPRETNSNSSVVPESFQEVDAVKMPPNILSESVGTAGNDSHPLPKSFGVNNLQHRNIDRTPKKEDIRSLQKEDDVKSETSGNPHHIDSDRIQEAGVVGTKDNTKEQMEEVNGQQEAGSGPFRNRNVDIIDQGRGISDKHDNPLAEPNKEGMPQHKHSSKENTLQESESEQKNGEYLDDEDSKKLIEGTNDNNVLPDDEEPVKTIENPNRKAENDRYRDSGYFKLGKV